MLFPPAQRVPPVERTWHKVGHPLTEAQQQMGWLRISTAAKIWKCHNKIKHIGWGKREKKNVWKWEPEIRINVEGSKIKNVISIALRTQFMCRRFKRRNKGGCLFLDSFKWWFNFYFCLGMLRRKYRMGLLMLASKKSYFLDNPWNWESWELN